MDYFYNPGLGPVNEGVGLGLMMQSLDAGV